MFSSRSVSANDQVNLNILRRPFNFGQAKDGIRRFLLALKEAHPGLAYWEMLGKTPFQPLRHDLGDVAVQLLLNEWLRIPSVRLSVHRTPCLAQAGG